jgi:hypothetical protein
MSLTRSTPDEAGLGTLGFNQVGGRGMTCPAGLTRFRRLDHGNPTNTYDASRKLRCTGVPSAQCR